MDNPNEQPTQPTDIPSESPKTCSLQSMIAAVVITAVVVGGGMYGVITKFDENQSESITETTQRPETQEKQMEKLPQINESVREQDHQQIPAEPPADPRTDTWPVYTNQEYGFEVKYPDHLQFSESTSFGQKGFFFTNTGGEEIITQLAILPTGEFDSGFSPTYETELIQVGPRQLAAERRYYADVSFESNIIVFSNANDLPASWSFENHRIEFHEPLNFDELDPILSTFRFLD